VNGGNTVPWSKNEKRAGGILVLLGLLAVTGVFTLDDWQNSIGGLLNIGDDVPDSPVGEGAAQIWRITTKDSLSGADLTVDSVSTLVNGIEIGDPGLSAGYVEYTAHPIFTADVIQFQMVESGYYTVVKSFTVPKLGELAGGQTYHTVYAGMMYQDTTSDPTVSATYGGTDIDASAWDVSASTEYSGVKATLDVSMSAMNDLAFGGEPYVEIVGDKDRMGKFIHFDCNDSDVTVKDVTLEGVPLTLVWQDSSAGSDFQLIYEFSQMVYNDADVSGDGLYDFIFTIVFSSDDDQEIVINLYDLEDFENVSMGAPAAVDETVTIGTT
jgi:hypothetical protein